MKGNLRRKKLHRTNRGEKLRHCNSPDLIWMRKITSASQKMNSHQGQTHTFSHQYYHIYSNSQMNSITFIKSLPTQVHVLQVICNFRSQFQLLPQIRISITLTVKSSIISIDSNITDIIMKEVTRTWVYRKKTQDQKRSPAEHQH